MSLIVTLVWPSFSYPSISILTSSQWPRSTYKHARTPWCSSDVPLKQRDSHSVEPFQTDGDVRFLVSTKRILGTGVTLTAAFRSVNLDADWEARWDVQCDGRHIRLSQKNKKTYTYYLVLDDTTSLDHEILDGQVRSQMLRERDPAHLVAATHGRGIFCA